MKGHMGTILRLDLTNREISTIDTSEYEEWVGGHGMGSAIFFDLVDDKTVDAFSEENVITMMTSPLAGTLAPAAAGRTEVQGISPQPYPTEWFNRSNFGGRFAGMLKYAGYDGIVIEGKADEPVWVNVVDDEVTFESAESLWGLSTWETQTEIWQEVDHEAGWNQPETKRDTGQTTQRPAIATIGPAGEAEIRYGAIIHDAGNGAGNAGFGSVWGFKNLKAISVLGTGSVEIANPSELLKVRTEMVDEYGYDLDDHRSLPSFAAFSGSPGAGAMNVGMEEPIRAQGCLGCHKNCRKRTASGQGNESSCVDVLYYDAHDQAKHGEYTEETAKAADLTQRYGINNYTLEAGIKWLKDLHKRGILGPDGEIEGDLPWSELGNAVFAERLIQKIINREGIGADLAEGLMRAAEKWGRLEEDLASGSLSLQYWGYPHHYDARTEVEWGYGSILGERDINEHDFNWSVYWQPSTAKLTGNDPPVTAERLAEIIQNSTEPYNVVPDYSDEGIYSQNMVELVAWHRHYTRFWKQTALYCDWAYADFINPYGDDMSGLTPEGEPLIYNAVTGENITFEEGIEKGRRIWNLDRAIWTLQGRHADMEEFAEYTYEVGAKPGYTTYEIPYYVPVQTNGKWEYKDVSGRTLDRTKFNDWKRKFYEFENWDPETGRPTRSGLEAYDLGFVADELEANGFLQEG
ncbi:aldehyde ferredoxin oxidoreductase [Halodesulfurarchaeum formicicum]|uniref:Aldehyde ferredoxin oxidoreductase n=1 Tax=Halodesulfurarchaeum formicicum TaxID=1873524 RepID=A0A1D8S3L6_9EURY|nr:MULTISPECIES: aldehyde ferredoxin oxidoreductase N-terminal domain-containing protein [Halodesulfurarchaeum]AOW79943.1 aldehyde ferredoxin oxidoreductase [Halodesulfurarchaeum formicicum]MDR5657480.1 aldehyde ferredoxin oxidoreductase N-terminal domain-containing protein [Halodesulfurarchaeum sp. HSR-GB]